MVNIITVKTVEMPVFFAESPLDTLKNCLFHATKADFLRKF